MLPERMLQPDGYRANARRSTSLCLLNFSNPIVRLIILYGMSERHLDIGTMGTRTHADNASPRNRLPDGSVRCKS